MHALLLFAVLLKTVSSYSTSSASVSTLAGSGSAGYQDGTSSYAYFRSPTGIAIDSPGANLYVADNSNYCIRQIEISTGTVTTLAGSTSYGYYDGTGANASFTNPTGIAVDSSGTNLYVTDGSSIREIVISTRAVTHMNLTESSYYGSGTPASFNIVAGIAIDSSDNNLYVADRGNHCIRKVVINWGVVSTVAGSGYSGFYDGTGAAAYFNNPTGIAIDSLGIVLYVADSGNHRIRKIIIPTGEVTTVAGSSYSGYSDGTGAAAYFVYPTGISVDSSGTILYVTDSSNNRIRQIVISTGAVTTVAGSGSSGYSNGIGTAAYFNNPTGIAVDSSGTKAYVADGGNNVIRKIFFPTSNLPTSAPSYHRLTRSYPSAAPSGLITAALRVVTLAGNGSYGYHDGIGTKATFCYPLGIVVDASRTNLYVADSDNHCIRKIVISTGAVTTVAVSDSFGHLGGTDDSPPSGTASSFYYPAGVAIDLSSKNLYVADRGNNRIRQIIISTGVISTVAGSGYSGYQNGIGTAASFNYPGGIAVDSSGTNLYVADSGNNVIRQIYIPTGAVLTLAGSGLRGDYDGTGTDASFDYPGGIAVDSSGSLYAADTGNSRIRKIIISTRVVTTLAGSGDYGYQNGIGTAASFVYPSGIAVDSSGTNLYVTDGNVIRQIVISTGAVTTLAGNGSYGYLDGSRALFSDPEGIAVDSSGSLYLADSGNHRIREVSSGESSSSSSATNLSTGATIGIAASIGGCFLLVCIVALVWFYIGNISGQKFMSNYPDVHNLYPATTPALYNYTSNNMTANSTAYAVSASPSESQFPTSMYADSATTRASRHETKKVDYESNIKNSAIELTTSPTKPKLTVTKVANSNVALLSLTEQQVLSVVTELGLSNYIDQFVDAALTGALLLSIETTEDLQACGIVIPGPMAKSLFKFINRAKIDGVESKYLKAVVVVPTKPKVDAIKLTDSNVTVPLSSLTEQQVLSVVTELGLSKFINQFEVAAFTGALLENIETADDLTDCGISMPGPMTKLLLKFIKQANEVGVDAKYLN